MRFNSKKCHISRQRNKCSPVYNLRTDLLSTANSHNYLGITVSSDLKGHEHISNICYKATRTLNFVRRWAETWQMRFNSKKCHISRQHNKCSPVYNLRTDLLSTANSHTYLGITVSSDLKGHEHISNICYKATRTLNFVRRNTYCCSHEAKNLAYVLSSSPLGVRRCSEGSAYCQPAT